MKVAVVGTGLIGASIGAGLRAAGWAVAGWDPDPRAVDAALEVDALDEAAADLERLVATDPDIVVVAAPPLGVIDVISRLDTGALVTDVAGVKGPILAAARRLDRFVGGHPMAGRESHGAEHASPALFRGAAWIVTPDGSAEVDVELVEQMAHQLGARPVRMTATEHDEAVALVSHLPQLLAVGLLESAELTGHALDLAAGSFRDLTRVASSDPSTWGQVLAANRDAVGARLRDFANHLDALADSIDGGDAEGLRSRLERAKQVRGALSPPVVSVGVALADEPGELAKVGRALAASGVDVRDLQLRHGRHGGGGVLTLSIRPGEAATLRSALTDVGLELLA